MTGNRYEVGERVYHQAFGEGLVVDLRARDFFDILEIAFSDGVRKVTSIHPQLRHLGADEAVPAQTRKREAADDVAPARSAPPARRSAQPQPPALDDRLFRRAPILRLDRDSVDPWLARRPPEPESPEAFLWHLEALRVSRRRGFERLLALNSTRDVQRLEHQIRACLRVLREMKGRALLADEVGLGKTIEAGLILKEYILRGLVSKALVLVPASLLTQWREELTRKFGIPAVIYGRGDDWGDADYLIASLDTAKSARNRQRIAEESFDLLIVDEAHRLRNHLTQAWKFIDSLSLKYLLLLTATPVQNDLRELYNLVTLLRPGALGTYRRFRQDFVVRGDRRLPKNTRELSRLLADVMIRTTRSSTSIKFPRRDVESMHLDLSDDERRFYDAVSGFVQEMATTDPTPRRRLPWPLLLMILQKEIGSSPAAAIGTLERAASGRLSGVRPQLTELLVLGRAVRRQVKLEALDDLVRQARREGDRLLVFSQFRRTVEYLGRELAARGARVSLFHGSLTASAKDAAVAAFRQQRGVLISTEAGGEGRNLQFCRTLVNYDLPWNPMRVEQRIGRVHRIGQAQDVRIINLSARDTLESYVLQILQEKIKMFHLVIGEMDQILGNLEWDEPFETHVFRLWARSRKPAALEEAFEELGEELEGARERYEHVKAYDREVFEGTEAARPSGNALKLAWGTGHRPARGESRR
ncbi:MAG: ATP-dependent helicase [Candidatus Eisenbacteria bacterium]|nr:ATP-dependent helicase [Candidatus Eisenbacteria bacterium]